MVTERDVREDVRDVRLLRYAFRVVTVVIWNDTVFGLIFGLSSHGGFGGGFGDDDAASARRVGGRSVSDRRPDAPTAASCPGRARSVPAAAPRAMCHHHALSGKKVFRLFSLLNIHNMIRFLLGSYYGLNIHLE